MRVHLEATSRLVRLAQTTATGRSIEPVSPVIFSGSTTKKNS
jgi:hypothetical protein